MVHVETPVGLSREIPCWMCDAETCAALTEGPAFVAATALAELRGIVTDELIAARSGAIAEAPGKEVRIDEAQSPSESTASDVVRDADRGKSKHERVDARNRRRVGRSASRGGRATKRNGGQR